MKSKASFAIPAAMLLAGGFFMLRETNAQQTRPSPETPAQRIANEARAAGIELRGDTSFSPVIDANFNEVMKKMRAAKPEIMKRQMSLLEQRYDLGNKPAPGVTMSRGKPVQGGVRAKLPVGVTWDQLAAMTPDEIRQKKAFPPGFLPLPHPNHAEGFCTQGFCNSLRRV